ncbi:hypothetical protein RMSM_00314 [Rhodopirellula maiorica SM1]|uniref:Uncharacterized protein n=1 Tax=Rhodopirellula maiorica SM1 TaxID=1265738 RepID=M5RU90_9BACT|nr:hypothetical protein RMSM_00314 [Rhodopirellula maiorica SM1]
MLQEKTRELWRIPLLEHHPMGAKDDIEAFAPGYMLPPLRG